MQPASAVINCAVELYLKKTIRTDIIAAPINKMKISSTNLSFMSYKISPGTKANHSPITVITRNTMWA